MALISIKPCLFPLLVQGLCLVSMNDCKKLAWMTWGSNCALSSYSAGLNTSQNFSLTRQISVCALL